MKKLLILGVIALFIGVNVIPSTSCNIAEEIPSKNITKVPTNTPLPPLMWTEDFLTFYIKIPDEPSGNDVYFFIDWGDEIEEWIGPYDSNETISITHIWDEGEYKIKVKVKFQNCESKYATYRIILSSDFDFFGVIIGYVNIDYKFSLRWDDGIYFFIDWGDGTYSGWLGPYQSNESIVFSHSWSLPGEYVWKIRFKDIHGQQGPWIQITIKIMPLKNKSLVKPSIKGIKPTKPINYYYKFKTTNQDGDLSEEDCIECQSNDRPICDHLLNIMEYYNNLASYYVNLAYGHPEDSFLYRYFMFLSDTVFQMVLYSLLLGAIIDCWDIPY